MPIRIWSCSAFPIGGHAESDDPARADGSLVRSVSHALTAPAWPNSSLNRPVHHPRSVTGSARARAASCGHPSSPCKPDQIFFGRHQHQPLALGAARTDCSASAACSDDDRESCAWPRPRCRRPRAWQRISPGRRCRQRPAPGRPPSAARKPASGSRRAAKTGSSRSAAAATTRRRRRCPITSSASALSSCAASGARSGPAGVTMPLPMPRRASTTSTAKVLGERRVLKAVIHDDDARSGRDRQRSRPARGARHDGRRGARKQQRLVADIGRAMHAAGSTRSGPASRPP